jgi:hypothetical protein
MGLQPAQERSGFLLEILVGHGQRRRPGNQYQIEPSVGRDQGGIGSEQRSPGHLPEAPAGSVALDRLLELPADRDADPGRTLLASCRHDYHPRSRLETLAATEQALKILASSEA